MPLTPDERKDKLNRLLDLLQTSKYRYDEVKSGVNVDQLPPAPGTSMNCESAARIFIQIASDMGVEGLEALYYKSTAQKGSDNMGYLVLQSAGIRALGNPPAIRTSAVMGWEFENHWRVKDPVTQLIYDPTFGTVSPLNPKGVLATNMDVDKKLNMTTVYGGKYTIVRKGVVVTCSSSPGPLTPSHIITDQDFRPRQMSGLRLSSSQ